MNTRMKSRIGNVRRKKRTRSPLGHRINAIHRLTLNRLRVVLNSNVDRPSRRRVFLLEKARMIPRVVRGISRWTKLRYKVLQVGRQKKMILLRRLRYRILRFLKVVPLRSRHKLLVSRRIVNVRRRVALLIRQTLRRLYQFAC